MSKIKHPFDYLTEDDFARIEKWLNNPNPTVDSATEILGIDKDELRLKIDHRGHTKSEERLPEMGTYINASLGRETQGLLTEKGAQTRHDQKSKRLNAAALVSAALLGSTSEVRLPTILVKSNQSQNPTSNNAFSLELEIIAGLSSSRSFDLVQLDYFDEENNWERNFIAGHDLGNYLLRFMYYERSGKVAVQFEDRTTGRIVFNEIVDLAYWDGVVQPSSAIVGRIHSYSSSKLRNPVNSSLFARWYQAEALLWDVDPQSDLKALGILDQCEIENPTFSRIFATKSQIYLNQMSKFPLQSRNSSIGVADALVNSEKAVALDPWVATNHISYGLALLATNENQYAKRAFLTAERLDGSNPATLVSIAGGLAYAGETLRARQLAQRAASILNPVPRVFYDTLGTIAFADSAYEEADYYFRQGTRVALSNLTAQVAALILANREKEAFSTLQEVIDTQPPSRSEQGLSRAVLQRWRTQANYFNNEKSRRAFDDAAKLVQDTLSDQ